MELISMTCRNCGGKLMITKDSDQCICQHCGTEYLVSVNEGTVSIKLLAENLKNIQLSSKNVAVEMALERLRNERNDIWITGYSIYKIFAFGDIKLVYPKNYEDTPDLFIQRIPNTFNPRGLLILLETTTAQVKQSFFPSAGKIEKLEQAREKCLMLIKRLDEIDVEEKSYLQTLKES